MAARGFSKEQMAQRAAAEIPAGVIVNLGIGLPTLCADYLPEGHAFLHSENGLLGMGPFPYEGEEDPQLINAGNWRTADATRLNDAERWSYTANEVIAVNRYYDPVHLGPDRGWRIDRGDLSASFHPKADGTWTGLVVTALVAGEGRGRWSVDGGRLTVLMTHVLCEGSWKAHDAYHVRGERVARFDPDAGVVLLESGARLVRG